MNTIINQECREKLSSNRTVLMGIGIVLVLIFHLGCAGFSPLEGRFNIGYSGVDIFMLCSGFGLVKSYTRNTLKEFWIRRLVRIMPLWLITAAIYTLLTGNGWGYFVLNITTLIYYYNFGRDAFEWYISAIILLYLIYPLLYRYWSCKRTIYYIMMTSGILFFYVALKFMTGMSLPIYWMLLLSRMPAFIMGIMVAKRECFDAKNIIILFLLFCIPVWLFEKFLGVDLLIIALILIYICNRSKQIKQNKILVFLGKYSLEIYLSNLIWLTINKVYGIEGDISIILSFIFVHPVCTAIFIYLNYVSQKIIRKYVMRT